MNDPKPVVLVVDDEEDLVDLLTYNLQEAGLSTLSAANGLDALEIALAEQPSLALLDLMMPGLDGVALCRRLREESLTANTPILMLTARDAEEDVVAGLEAGADDYVTKPFSVKEVVARIKALLRRSRRQPDELDDIFNIGDLVINRARYEVQLDGALVTLTLSEFLILDALARRQGSVMTRTQIVTAIRGTEVAVTERSIDVHVTALRKKMGARHSMIVTVRGVGYRFAI